MLSSNGEAENPVVIQSSAPVTLHLCANHRKCIHANKQSECVTVVPKLEADDVLWQLAA